MLRLQDDERLKLAADLRTQLLDAEGLGAAVESLVYRTLQESLTNVRKHAKASRVSVRLHEVGGALVGMVVDDGVGFDVDAELEQARQTFHVGIDIVSERVRLAGGSFDLLSTPGTGTQLRFTIPVP